MRKLQFICVILALLLFLSACGQQSGESASNTNVPIRGYIEEDVSPKTAVSGGALSVFADGRVSYMAYMAGRIPVAFVSGTEPMSFEEVDNTAVRAFVEQAGDNLDIDAILSSDGTWWVSTQSETDLLPSLIAISADSTQTQIPLNHTGDRTQRYTARTLVQDGDKFISLLLILEDETQSECFLVSFDAASMEPVSNIRCPIGTLTVYVKNGMAYSLDFGGGLSVYDIESGEKENSKVLPQELVNDLIKSSYCIDDNGDFCAVNGNGIQKIALEGNKPQTIVSDASHAYAGAAFSRSSIVSLQQDQFLVSFSELGKGKVFLYKFGEYTPEEEQNLHLWALEEQPILREAVMQYRRANPQVNIILEYGRSKDENAQTDEDIIRALNTRLLADECPDVLVLDGLPAQSYISSGLLSSLEGLIDESVYYGNVIECYKGATGTFAYPIFFRIPALLSTVDNEDTIEKITTLQDLAALCENQEAMYFNNYDDLFNTLYGAYSATMFPNDSSVVESDVRAFLEHTAQIADSLGLSMQPSYLYGDNTPPGQAYIPSSQGVTGFKMDRPYGAAILNDYSDIYLSAHRRGDIVCTPLPGNAFVPYISAAIPVGSANTDAAKAFVQYMLTDGAVQSSVYKSGFSVLKGNDHTDYSLFLEEALADSEYPKPIGDSLSFNLDGLIEKLRHMSGNSIVLKNKLYIQAMRLYQGQANLDTVVAEVMRDVQIYLNEQR